MQPRIHTRWIVACFCLPAVAWIVATRTAGQTSQPAAPEVKSHRFVEVKAHRFVLTDADGTPRAGMTADKNGPKLALYDSKGITRATVAVAGDKPAVALFGPDENDNGPGSFFQPILRPPSPVSPIPAPTPTEDWPLIADHSSPHSPFILPPSYLPCPPTAGQAEDSLLPQAEGRKGGENELLAVSS